MKSIQINGLSITREQTAVICRALMSEKMFTLAKAQDAYPGTITPSHTISAEEQERIATIDKLLDLMYERKDTWP